MANKDKLKEIAEKVKSKKKGVGAKARGFARQRVAEFKETRAQKKLALKRAKFRARAERKEAFIEARKKRILGRARAKGKRAGRRTRIERVSRAAVGTGKKALKARKKALKKFRKRPVRRAPQRKPYDPFAGGGV